MLTKELLEKYEVEQERQEAIEHRDVLLSIGSILQTSEGLKLFRYLFKTFGTAELPDINMEGNILQQYLGHLRTGEAIFKLACEADSDIGASILSKLERERYDKLRERQRLEQGLYDNNSKRGEEGRGEES